SANQIRLVMERAQAGVAEGTLHAEQWPVKRKIVAPLDFDDRGFVQGQQWQTEFAAKPLWMGATRKILDSAILSPPYAAILAAYPSVDPSKVRQGIEAICHRILPDTLNGSSPTSDQVSELVKRLVDELAGHPVPHGVVINLMGIGLQPERVDLSTSGYEV